MADERREGLEIQKPNVQMMLQDFAATQRALADERRNSERRIAEERELSQRSQARIREEYESRTAGLEAQIRTLLDIIADLRKANDQLRIDAAIADVRNREAAARQPAQTSGTPPVQPVPAGAIPLVGRGIDGLTQIPQQIPIKPPGMVK